MGGWGVKQMFPSSLPQTLQNTDPFLFLQSISAVLLLSLVLVWQYGFRKKKKNLGVHYDRNGGIFMREVEGRNQEVALGTPLMIHSDPRRGRC